MERNLKGNNQCGEKLLGVRKTALQTVKPAKSVDVTGVGHNDRVVEKALVEAAHRKAEAIVMIRRHAFAR